MLPDLGRLSLHTGSDFYDNIGRRKIYDFLNGCMGNVGCGEYIMCDVYSGTEGGEDDEKTTVVLEYKKRTLATLHTNDNYGRTAMDETVFYFEFRGERSLKGLVREYCFPQLGLGPGWTSLSYSDRNRERDAFDPHREYEYIAPDDEEMVEMILNGGNEAAIDKARGGDAYTFSLDPRELETYGTRMYDKVGNAQHGIATNSTVYAYNFWMLDGNALVVLSDSSRQMRYQAIADAGDEDQDDIRSAMNLPGKLEQVNISLAFRQEPDQPTPGDWMKLPYGEERKRPRS